MDWTGRWPFGQVWAEFGILHERVESHPMERGGLSSPEAQRIYDWLAPFWNVLRRA